MAACWQQKQEERTILNGYFFEKNDESGPRCRINKRFFTRHGIFYKDDCAAEDRNYVSCARVDKKKKKKKETT